MKKEAYLERISQLLELEWVNSRDYDVVSEIYVGTISIATQLWGGESEQVGAIRQLREDMEASNWTSPAKAQNIVAQCKGVLKSIAYDLNNDLISSIQLDSQGQVFAGFVNASKAALDEGRVDVAAVLVAAALEDSLKKYAQSKTLEVEDKDMSEVINALKGGGHVSKTQGALVKGMVPFRNKALHAEWDNIDSIEVRGVLGFVEELLNKRFL